MGDSVSASRTISLYVSDISLEWPLRPSVRFSWDSLRNAFLIGSSTRLPLLLLRSRPGRKDTYEKIRCVHCYLLNCSVTKSQQSVHKSYKPKEGTPVKCSGMALFPHLFQNAPSPPQPPPKHSLFPHLLRTHRFPPSSKHILASPTFSEHTHFPHLPRTHHFTHLLHTHSLPTPPLNTPLHPPPPYTLASHTSPEHTTSPTSSKHTASPTLFWTQTHSQTLLWTWLTP